MDLQRALLLVPGLFSSSLAIRQPALEEHRAPQARGEAVAVPESEVAEVEVQVQVQVEVLWLPEDSTQAGVLHGTSAHGLDSLPWHDRVDG